MSGLDKCPGVYKSSYSVTRGPGKKLVKSGRKLDGREKQGQGSRCCEKKWQNSLKYKQNGQKWGEIGKNCPGMLKSFIFLKKKTYPITFGMPLTPLFPL